MVGEHRLLDPMRSKRRELVDPVGSVLRRPRLVGIGHDRRIITERFAQCGEVADVAYGTEADLELERAEALRPLGKRDVDDAIGADPARIYVHRVAGAAEPMPQRLAGATGSHVP